MTDNNLNTNAIKEKQEVEIIINNKFSENNLNLEIIFNKYTFSYEKVLSLTFFHSKKCNIWHLFVRKSVIIERKI